MIDREKVLKEIAEEIHLAKWAEQNYRVINLSTLRDIFELLKKSKDIIHCKDCKHFTVDNPQKDYGVCVFNSLINPNTFYCADGERKEKK